MSVPRLLDLGNYERLIVTVNFSLNPELPSTEECNMENKMTKKLISMYKTIGGSETLSSLVKLYIGYSSNYHKLTSLNLQCFE